VNAPASDWKLIYQLAKSEKDPQRRSELCERARRLIQDRSLQMADGETGHEFNPMEENELNQALRDLWILQSRPA